jgi:hypothetical protein
MMVPQRKPMVPKRFNEDGPTMETDGPKTVQDARFHNGNQWSQNVPIKHTLIFLTKRSPTGSSILLRLNKSTDFP